MSICVHVLLPIFNTINLSGFASYTIFRSTDFFVLGYINSSKNHFLQPKTHLVRFFRWMDLPGLCLIGGDNMVGVNLGFGVNGLCWIYWKLIYPGSNEWFNWQLYRDMSRKPWWNSGGGGVLTWGNGWGAKRCAKDEEQSLKMCDVCFFFVFWLGRGIEERHMKNNYTIIFFFSELMVRL